MPNWKCCFMGHKYVPVNQTRKLFDYEMIADHPVLLAESIARRYPCTMAYEKGKCSRCDKYIIYEYFTESPRVIYKKKVYETQDNGNNIRSPYKQVEDFDQPITIEATLPYYMSKHH